MLIARRGNGVDSRSFHCGSLKSTLMPCVLSVVTLSCAIKFLKRVSSFDCLAQELSA